MNNIYKTFATTFIYTKKSGGGSLAEQSLIEYIMKADRINKSSEAFKPVLDAIKTRQTTAVLYRVLLSEEVVLSIYSKELPASFKVFTASDVKTNTKDKKTFIDLTGIVTFNNGYFNCREVDKLCAYLLSALTNLVYYAEPTRLTNNGVIINTSTVCYVKLFTGIFDYLRIINYSDSKEKISYIVAVYYLYTMLGKDINAARSAAASIVNVPVRESSAYDIYYDYEKDFDDIDIFINSLAETFKLKGLTTDVFLDRWIYLYGKGTMYGCELLPSFLSMITNAYSGSYINNQKKIETSCGRDMVTLSTTILQVGAEMYNRGFRYESFEDVENARYRLENKYGE